MIEEARGKQQAQLQQLWQSFALSGGLEHRLASLGPEAFPCLLQT
jgi:hypothetical protein